LVVTDSVNVTKPDNGLQRIWRKSMVSERAKRSPLPILVAILAALEGTAAPPVAFADPSNICIQGYVWRAARPGDAVCVGPGVRDTTAQ
jgi:hypothetical protein